MLFNPPPGFQTGSTNKQTVSGLAVPGLQAHAVTPGTNNMPGKNPFPVPGTSSYSAPSSQTSTMNPYFKSGNGNLSTLLRVLLGKTT
jgi:hypothetical protein